MSEVITLGDLARQGRVILNDGYRTRADELGQPGLPILRVAEVQDGFITPSVGDHVHENFRPKFAAKTSAAGDIVVTTKGTVGRVAMMREHHPVFVYSPQVCFFRCGADCGVLPEWLYYWFKGPEFVSQALGVQSQTDMAPYINLADMRAVAITVPPLAEQRAIAGVLGALDDKIESNRRIVVTVDGLVRAEFVDASADPDGEEVSFAALAERINRAANPNNLDGSTPYIGLEHMPRGSMILDDWGMAAGLESGKSFFERGDVLFGKLRPYFRKVGVAPVTGVCSTDVLVLRPRRGLGLLVAVAASEELIAYASNAASGTKMPRASWEYIADFKVTVPGAERSASFEATVAPALDRALTAVDECRSLAAVRDALLPELLSGRLRVREAEEMVGSV